MDPRIARYALYAAIIGVGLLILYKVMARSHKIQTISNEPSPHVDVPPILPPSSQTNSQEAAVEVAGSCPSFGKQCGSGGVTNLSAAMGAAPTAVGFSTPCQASRETSKMTVPVSVSPWVKDMFAGSPPVGKPSNPSNVNSVYDHATIQTLDASGPVGFGLASPPASPYKPSCSGGQPSSQEYMQAHAAPKACAAC